MILNYFHTCFVSLAEKLKYIFRLTFCLETKSNQKFKTAPKKLKINHLY